MNSPFDTSRLSPSNDPLELLAALVDIPKAQLGHLKSNLTALLKHPDADVRVHAFRRLFVHLRDPSSRAEAVDALRQDSDPKVRRVAAHAISATSSAETRREDSARLLASLLDEKEVTAVRGASYEALLLIHGRNCFPPANREIRFEEDVDWEWIHQIRSSLE